MSEPVIPQDLKWLGGLADDLQAEVIRLRAAEAALAEATLKLEILPADWQTDSSLETWFPFTAEELERTKQQLYEAQQERGEWRAIVFKVAGAVFQDAHSKTFQPSQIPLEVQNLQQQITQQAATVDQSRDALETIRPALCNAEQYLGSIHRSTTWSRRVHNETSIALQHADAALASIPIEGKKPA
jgi:hypothetical protein